MSWLIQHVFKLFNNHLVLYFNSYLTLLIFRLFGLSPQTVPKQNIKKSSATSSNTDLETFSYPLETLMCVFFFIFIFFCYMYCPLDFPFLSFFLVGDSHQKQFSTFNSCAILSSLCLSTPGSKLGGEWGETVAGLGVIKTLPGIFCSFCKSRYLYWQSANLFSSPLDHRGNTVMIQICLGKQCRPRSDCS